MRSVASLPYEHVKVKLDPRVCVIDSFTAEKVPTQGALLAKHLEKEGLSVQRTSKYSGSLVRAIDTALTLVRYSSEYDVALIQVFGRRAFQYARLSSWIAKRLGKRVVLVLRGGTLPSEWQRQPERLRAVLNRADSIIAPSTYMADVFREAGYTIEIIPNFIELERYPFRLRDTLRPKLFWMRAFHQQYNPQMAIETLAILKKLFPDATLSMGGPDSDELQSCKQLAEQLDVAGSVRFLGFLTKEQIVAEAAQHDIHLHTNRIDNTPVTLLENMALGLPIVATRVGGVSHLVHDGETALLVESEDRPAMAAAIERLLGDSHLSARLSRAGREFVESSCSWDAVRESWLAVLNRF